MSIVKGHGGKIVLAVALAGLFAFFYISGLGEHLTLSTLKANREALAAYYAEHWLLMIAAFMAIYIVQTALSLPGAAILSLTAGAIFGTIVGSICAVIAATIGATLAFLGTRYLLHDLIERKFGPRLESMNRELQRRGLGYLLFLRLVPAFPFFLINLASGLTKLPIRVFLIGTFIGIIPGSFVFCNAGESLASISATSDILSARVIGSFALLGIFALLPNMYEKIVRRRGAKLE